MEKHLHTAESIARLLDNEFSVFGLRFGLDPILGIIPGLGDVVVLFLGLYIIWIAMRLGVPEDKIGVMVRNLFFDFLLGAIPVVGDIADVFYKANIKNLRILKEFSPRYTIENKQFA